MPSFDRIRMRGKRLRMRGRGLRMRGRGLRMKVLVDEDRLEDQDGIALPHTLQERRDCWRMTYIGSPVLVLPDSVQGR